MEKDPSPLDTLRQLKEWLDAGTITPAEFDTLKRKLLFSEQNASASAPPAPATPATPVAPPPAPTEPPVVVGPPASPVPPLPSSAAGGFGQEPPRPPVVMKPVEPEFRPTPPVVPPVTPPPVHPVPPVETYSYTRDRPAEPVYTNVPAPQFEANELPDEPDEAAYVAPARSPLSTILIVGGILALLALIAYLTLGNRESERLSSLSRTEQDSLATKPEEGPQAEQIDLPPAAAPETVRVAPALPPAAAPAQDSAATVPATSPAQEATPAAAPAVDESAVRSRIESTLSAYYEDMKAAPFSAAQYFSPTVERFYTLQNTTPAAINEELTRSHFPEFLEASTEIEPGSLQISDVANDGSRVVTFLEKSQALRQSLQKHQQTRAQVRVRFDKNYKIKYLRQERLLENTFTD
ncbi:SHOCT domain-containing protein [Hymenobacter metallicola]|uniref:SHOCT domain-containing protein n=1 Tax=Hymenobacter metallicola TaxID=2563114 RepID=A0A4Z0QD25_9BACT|nr:SHOCT domain-containing protein [Hymenobacter metallicola]TGE27073.1 SHOCT domain-containing protein [Hymenobacter metallicola]